MNTLVVFLPPRPRLRASALSGPGADEVSTEYAYALSPDGISVGSQGRATPGRLPKASTVVAVVSESDLSWHHITLPRAPASRLRAALGGVLEEALLDDTDALHLAVAPHASAGSLTWVVAVDRAWLATELGMLEKASVFVDRVVPLAWPDEPPSGHFGEMPGDSSGEQVQLTWAHGEGVVQLPLHGSLARALLPDTASMGTRWSATPGASLTAEQWLGQPVQVLTPAQRALLSARSLWDLRQFALARKNRGLRAVRDTWRQFLSPSWRPVRYGLIALVLVQIVGLNLWAWQQRGTLQARQKAIVALLQTTHPQVRAVLDAPVQMERETDTLRAAAGRAGESDLEPMLQLAAAAWPSDRPPVDDVRYEPPGKLTLAAAGWAPEQIDQFRNQLTPAGWRVDAEEGRLVITRRPAGTGGRP